jgi:hypothetical protein
MPISEYVKPVGSGYDLAMPRRLRHATCVTAFVLASVAALMGSSIADAKPTRCKSADLRYPFHPGGPKTFGVFRLKITNGTCATAHRVAKRWMKRFEASPSATVPRHVFGFTFKTLPATEAQAYRERGRNGTKTIRFVYRVPNG